MVVFLIFDIGINWVALESFLGLSLLIANGVWASYVFGMLGARYGDLGQILNSIMRIVFLATSIIWMPGDEMRCGAMDTLLTHNLVYHSVELVRAPLLGESPALLSWSVAIGFTGAGFFAAWFFKRHCARHLPFWL